jgi:hypothetical protein
MKRGDARAVRFDLAEALGTNPLGDDAVRGCATLQLCETRQFTVVHGDDDLPAELVWDAGVIAEALQLIAPASAKLRFEGARGVVDA